MEDLALLKILMNNPISKFFLRCIAVECDIDNKSRFETGFEIYAGLRNHGCWKCVIVSKNISILIKILSIMLRFNEALFRKTLNKNPYNIRYLNSLLKGINYFGVKDLIIFGSPYIIYLEITDKCNLKCRHCSKKSQESGEELKKEEIFKIIDKLYNLGVSHICFSGGEPLIHREIFDVLRYARDKNFAIWILTNGTLLDKKTASELKKIGVKVRISLDFPDKERHDSFRGKNGAFEATIQGVKNVLDEKLDVYLCMTATRYNYKDIDKMINLCKKIGVNGLLVDSFIPTGRGKEIEGECDLNAKEREEFLKDLYKKMNNSDIYIASAFTQINRIAILEDNCDKIIPTYMGNFKNNFLGKIISLMIGGCPAGRYTFCIKSNGDINPCAFLKIKIGNIFKDDLEKIWFENELFQSFRDRSLLKPYCKNCKFRDSCGGCRARAYEEKNDALEADLSCIYNQGVK